MSTDVNPTGQSERDLARITEQVAAEVAMWLHIYRESLSLLLAWDSLDSTEYADLCDTAVMEGARRQMTTDLAKTVVGLVGEPA